MPHTADARPETAVALTIHVLPGVGPDAEAHLKFVQPGAQDVDTVASPAHLSQLAAAAVRSFLEHGTTARPSALPHQREQAAL